MRKMSAVLGALWLVLLSPAMSLAQSAGPAVSVPRLISVTGVYQPADGQPAPAGTVVTLAIYADPQGGAPLWQEAQTITLEKNGGFALLLGATQPDGVPLDVFTAGDAQWLGLTFAGVGEAERPRTRITSVPYALRSSDADTLGGRPASAYLLASTGAAGDSHTASAAATSANTGTGQSADVVLAGTANVVAKYVNSADVGPSALYEAGGSVGINTTTPADALHIRFTNTAGSMTGLAVQNLGNTAASYSGTLFYDQNGALGQFQGFNNVSHEYRINNIASSGSINFMLAGTSKFLVAPNGNIGIGTTAPSAPLEVSNLLTGGTANVWVTSYTNALGPYYLARRARGTPVAPTAVQTGDDLSGLYGQGYGATQFGPGNGAITIQAAQNFTDTQQGTAVKFFTTPMNSTTAAARMTLDASGNLGIGTTCPVCNAPAAGLLEVSNAASGSGSGNLIVGTNFAGPTPAGTLFTGRKARGTVGGPTAVQSGDVLVGFLGAGYGATAFSGTRGGMFVSAAENWSDAAQGTRLNFNTTATGTITPGTKMTIDPTGNVGLGTMNPIGAIEIVRNAESNFVGTLYNNGDGSAIFFQRARGTSQAPSAVLAGDALGYFGATGYAATTWGNGAGVIAVVAAENWTDTANGNAIGFATTPVGTTDFVVQAAILSNGNVGLGTPGDANGIPTATDKLQVFGDVRVGNATTNGCLKNFAGTGLVGVCVSDRRFKKNITPFGSVLTQLTALQPVHYYWRVTEFPQQHFGNAQAYGLIAQDVERVLPELVVTNEDGFKAIDYSKLPLLTIEAVKELKAENDALKAQNDALKDRVAEIERVIAELRTISPRH